MKQQRTAAELMIADQCPGIETEACIVEPKIIDAPLGQCFQAATEIVGQITDQASDEWQLLNLWRFGLTKALERVSQALQKSVGRFVGRWRQFCQWPGAHKIIASTLGMRAPGVQQYCAWCLANAPEVITGVWPVRKRVQGATGHAWQSEERKGRL